MNPAASAGTRCNKDTSQPFAGPQSYFPNAGFIAATKKKESQSSALRLTLRETKRLECFISKIVNEWPLPFTLESERNGRPIISDNHLQFQLGKNLARAKVRRVWHPRQRNGIFPCAATHLNNVKLGAGSGDSRPA